MNGQLTIQKQKKRTFLLPGCTHTLQRQATDAVTLNKVPPIVAGVLRSPGQPLDPRTRAYMESSLMSDFSKVQVHTDAKAAKSAQMINALAYTVKKHIVFRAGKYSSDTQIGQELIKHELTHVIEPGSRGKAQSGCFLQRFKDPQHEEMISTSLKGTDVESNWQEVYFGSWLRDYSQVLQADSNPAFKKIAIFVLNHMASKKFGLGVDEKRLGHYESVHHMDNPDVIPPATDKPIRDATKYIQQEIKMAADLGNSTEGRIHFGQALHVIEDFFSHSNFAWGVYLLVKKPGKPLPSLTTGVFQHKDTVVSILEMMVNFVNQKINWSNFNPTPGERLRSFMGRIIPLQQENRIPDMYYQDPRMNLENKIWFEALDILKPVLAKARREAVEAAKVPTHTELHQDDPSKPFFQIPRVLSIHITHEVTIQMGELWKAKDKQKELEKLFKLLDSRLQSPSKVSWWKPVIAEYRGIRRNIGDLEIEGKQ